MAWLVPWYAWVKAFHVISVIAWMAGMLYLPRLFVYHADAPVGSERSEMLKVMERRLLRLIVNPAMVASYLFGTLLLLTPGVVTWSQGWIWVKLVLIGLLTVAHHVYVRWWKELDADRARRPARTYRIANEVPTLLMIGIVIMVIVRPF